MKILIIEDNPGDVRLLEEYLAGANLPSVVLLEADSIAGAAGCFEEGPVDVILLDLGLPDGQGIESVRKVRRLAPLVPIVVLTGVADEELGVQALREGAQDYLAKNWASTRTVSRAVRYAVERSQAELRIRESEDKYRTLFETMAQGVVYFDSLGRVTSCNPAAERILGWDFEEVRDRAPTEVGFKTIRLDGCDYLAEEQPEIVALRTGREASAVMGFFNHRLGCHRWIDIHAMPRFRANEETPHEVFVSFADITELKELEEQRDLANRLREAADKLATQNEELQVAQAEAARLLEEQRTLFDLLQETLLDIPQELPGLRLGHLYRSATKEAQIGGDFYDVFEANGGRIGLLIGDVSGHGVEAARIAILVKDTVHAFAHLFRHPHLIFRETNRLLIQRKPIGFVSAFVGILDPDSGVLTYCSAGHPGPVLKVGGDMTVLESINVPLGVFADARYQDCEKKIPEDSLLLFYTDGIIEARNGGTFFGEEGLTAALERASDQGVETLPSCLLDEALRFSGGLLEDDAALLAVRYLGKK